MPTLTPTGGTTSCMIYLGQFSWTYDGSTSTLCMFREGTCISEWYWGTPVNVTKFNIFSHYYSPDSRITGIWGRVGAGWFLLWGYDEWNPSHATWDSKNISCDNCTGIRISQIHAQQTLKPSIAEVSIDYELDDFTLDEALTCGWVNGYNDHGPMVTAFDLDQLVYAYSEIHGPDMYGHTARHEWWYKEAGATEFTKRWEYNWTCGGHYTEWAQWTWWEIGGAYGPGEGYIKIYFDDVYMGKTNNYTILAGPPPPVTTAEFYACPGCGWWPGPFQVGMLQARIADYKVTNTGDQGGLVYVEIWEYPGESGYENRIYDANFYLDAGATGPSTAIPVNMDIPSLAFFENKYPGMPPPWPWDLCARVRGMDEDFESCVLGMTVGVVPLGWKGRRF